MALSITLNHCRAQAARLLFVRSSTNLNSSYALLQSAREIHRKSIYKTEKAKKIQYFVLDTYLNYLKNYDKILEKKFPTTMKTYRVFMDGFKFFIKDSKIYFKIVLMLHKSGSGNFNRLLRREIELYHQMPKDMRKVSPILAISPFPFAFYIILPVIYLFPKQVLCSHFWTEEQKETFSLQYLHDRLYHNRPVIRYLQGQLDYLNRNNHPLYDKWNVLLGQLCRGKSVTPEQILECQELFKGEPYHLMYLSHLHVRHLVRLHTIHLGWFRRTRLADRAAILIEMDKAILREGGVHNLPLEALKHCCYIRGLNPKDMKTEDMITWLRNWIKISSQINKENLSLLLHCPVLLGYNEPSNKALMKTKK